MKDESVSCPYQPQGNVPRRQQSSFDDLFDLLKLTPFWVGPVLAVIAFAVFRFLIPLLIPVKTGGFDAGVILRPLMTMLSWIIAGAVLVAWLIAEVHKLSARRLFDGQSGMESIRSISWREFERLVAEAYRRKGYLAEVVGNESGDGGVDIRLSRPGETILVQCKQWKSYTVGVKIVRELLGVVVSQQATGGIVVTSGHFTQEARQFAKRNSQLDLVDGQQLAELIRGAQTGQSASSVRQSDFQEPNGRHGSPATRCPSCGSGMVLRVARKGANAGSQFWGCANYPACRGTRPAVDR